MRDRISGSVRTFMSVHVRPANATRYLTQSGLKQNEHPELLPDARCLSQHTWNYREADSAFAPRTAARNAWACGGGGTEPVSTERKVTSSPYTALIESSSGRTEAPERVSPAKTPLARE